MITKNCGYIIKRDPQALASLLGSLNLTSIKQMGLRSRERYLVKYSSTIMVKSEIDYFENL